MHTRTLPLHKLCLSTLLLVAMTGILSLHARAQRAVNDADRVTLHGNTHALARAEFDRGAAPASLPMKNMIMLLSVRPDAQAQLDQLLSGQQDPSSPNFHKWLTPAEFGLRFGPTGQDIADATSWLRKFGFTIEQVGAGRLWINFSGDVQKVERAFQTNIRLFEVNGKMHHANATDPSIPRAFTGLVRGVVSMNDFEKHPNSTVTQLPPDFNAGSGQHFLAPGDFSIIYNVFPLFNQVPAIDGTGMTIAIVGRTDINLADVQYFRSFFGLPPHDPTFIVNGTDPGNLGGNEETEADLDVEWSGAIAKNAHIILVTSATTATTDGVDLSAQYIVNNNLAPVMSTSFGACEFNLPAAENAFWNSLWTQAATQGITAFVSAGDSGAAGCDPAGAAVGTQQGINGLASTPNNIAVGGTEFNEGAGNFWNASNSPVDQSSALGYIPENVWNESGNVAGGSGLFATGGGASILYAKPSWQSGLGVPGDGHRDIPDVSLSAAGHDAYLVIQGHTAFNSGLIAVSGTSASSPSFASIMALVVQKTGSAQGNANPILYSMARNQLAGGIGIYHDVTNGDNGVPGVPGFTAQVGYDQSSGWGSPDVTQLVNFWNNNAGHPDFTVNISPASRIVAQNSSTTFLFTVTAVNGYTGTLSFNVTGLPAGATFSFSPSTLTNQGTTTLTITTAATTALGSYPIQIFASDGTVGHSAAATLTVANPDFTIAATPASQTIIQGSSTSYTVTQSALNNYAATVSYSVSGLPAGATATFTPPSVAVSGTTTLAVSTAATTPGGSYALTITGTDGVITHTASVTLVVQAMDFSVAATPSSQSVVQGNSISYTVTQTAINNYAGTVTYSVLGLPGGATPTFTPATITGSGTATLSIAVATTTPAGSYPLTISGTDGTLTHTASVTLVVLQPDFSLAASPATQSINVGGSTSYTITQSALNGYTGTVSFSVTGLPAGATPAFTPASVTGSGTATLGISTTTSVAPGTYGLTITGTDGTLTHSASVTLIISTPDFSISAAPSSQTINQGSPTSYTVTLNPISGYSGTVTFSASGMPAGVSASFTPVSLTGSGSTALNITTAFSTTPGTYPLTITGTDGTLTHATSVTLVITPAGDFSMSTNIASQTVNPGQNTGYGITITSINGFSGTVSLSLSGLPAGATATFNPSSITGAGTSSLAITTSVATPAGVYNMIVTGTSGAITHTVGVQLIVNPATPGDFALSASPANITIKRHSSGSVTITVTPSNGFNGNVALGLSNVPALVTASLNPTTVNGGSGSSVLSLTVANNARQGTYQLLVTGTSGSLVHTIAVNLTIN
ncbi:MAG TPA: protease pro-enzyme activation domain-containing protein [Candidatus Angelobacter sp.]|nr:protease pro-enzyme activation domain-containing protein [Candidatus Angelobacter sp.]